MRSLAHETAVTSDERARLAELEREVRELRRANQILRKALAFFALADLDRQPRQPPTPRAARW